jgi:hypothetical protein
MASSVPQRYVTEKDVYVALSNDTASTADNVCQAYKMQVITNLPGGAKSYFFFKQV